MEMEIKETRHIIAYLDFLGVKKRICSGDTEFINQLKFIYHKAKQNCQKINDCTDNMKLTPIKQQIFSDNIVFAQEINTKNKDKMMFIMGSDELSTVDIVVFPRVYQVMPEFSLGDILKITGKVEKRYDQYQIVANKIIKLN